MKEKIEIFVCNLLVVLAAFENAESCGNKKPPLPEVLFSREWGLLGKPPSVMNEIRICRPYVYYNSNEICPNCGDDLKEF
ncbi:MAG: hypothetical protein LUC98_08625 [Lachnospiraceae bacterium]|nr:hypothetical protein [Lachnospiraceae bacterium]